MLRGQILSSKFQVQKGFTLVEVLIAISIIAVLSAIIIPNLRRFAVEQDVKNETSKLVQTLRQAQSNAQSGYLCTSGFSSKDWTVNFAANQYTLQASCINPSSPNTPVTQTTTYTFATPLTVSTLCSGSSFTGATFTNRTITFAGCTANEAEITLRSQSLNVNKVVVINRGGAIYEK